VTAVWLLATQYLGRYAVYLMPAAVARQMTLQTYLMLMQVVTTAIGVGIAAALLRDPLVQLGVGRPAARQLAVVLAATPIVFVVASYIAIGAAFQTLIDELARGGAEVSRQNAGEFGRALRQEPALLTILWGAVFAPVAEELLFRGAFWSLVTNLTQRLIRPIGRPRDSLAAFVDDGLVTRTGRALRSWLCTGGGATLLSAALFGWMHADMKGGVGIVRVVSTTCLGLACGTARHVTGTVATAMLLHFTFNALSIGQTRRWWLVGGMGNYYGVSKLLLLVAAGCALGLGVSWIVGRARKGPKQTQAAQADR